MSAKRLGMKLKELRTRQGLTPVIVTRNVRVTQAYIAFLEKRQQNPTLDVLKRLAKAAVA
jgi:transcriptional regulator with XRE-family HTH domain